MKKRYTTIALLTLLLTTGCNTNKDSNKTEPTSEIVEPTDRTNILSENNLINEDYIHTYGRKYYDASKNGVTYYYTATGFEVNFYGSELKATFTIQGAGTGSKCFYSVFLDGADLKEDTVFMLEDDGKNTKFEITLCTGLSTGNHTIKVLKRNEAKDCNTTLYGLKTDGYFRYQEKKSRFKIECLGGSGITGYGSLGREGETRTMKGSSSLHAFGYLTARMFDADFQFVSRSGWGLKWGYENSNLAQGYEDNGQNPDGTLPGLNYDHSFIPDAVLVNIGGNDFTSYVNSAEDQDTAKYEFRRAVLKFVTTIHTYAPNAEIYWIHTSSSNGTEAEKALANYQKKKQVNIVIMPKVGSDGDPQGASSHNSVYTHVRAAEIIATSIEQHNHVKRTKDNITWSDDDLKKEEARQ